MSLADQRQLGRHHRGARRQARGARGGFSYVELLVVLGIISILTALLLPMVGRMKASARSVRCTSNLHQIAMGFQHYALDNGGHLPEPLAIDLSWERILLPYVQQSSDVFICPADDEIAPSLGSSYDWRDTGDPLTTLAGAPITDAKAYTILVYDALPNWHVKGKMNAARMDGSATPMNAHECLADLMVPLRGSRP